MSDDPLCYLWGICSSSTRRSALVTTPRSAAPSTATSTSTASDSVRSTLSSVTSASTIFQSSLGPYVKFAIVAAVVLVFFLCGLFVFIYCKCKKTRQARRRTANVEEGNIEEDIVMDAIQRRPVKKD